MKFLRSKLLIERRKLLLAAFGATSLSFYPFLEARWLRLTKARVGFSHLPEAFDGLKIAFLSDFHHGKLVPLWFVRRAVLLAKAQEPDLVLFGGDYITGDPSRTLPCIECISQLRPTLGTFAVLGNHDNWKNPEGTRKAFKEAGIVDLTNRGFWIEKDGKRIRLCGVGDYWTEKQEIERAVGPAEKGDVVILLTHNPDYAEEIRTEKVDLMLCGHTHGGQIAVPLLGPPYIPSRYGKKYAHGFARGPRCLVFTSSGVGTVSLPMRLFCRPEVVLLTLVRTSRKREAEIS